MGSVAQIGLGIVILGAAFIFGHYVNEEAAKQTAVEAVVEDFDSPDDLVWSQPAEIQTLQSKRNLEPARSHAIELPGLAEHNTNSNSIQTLNETDYEAPVREALPVEAPPLLGQAPPLLAIEPMRQTSSDQDLVKPDFSGLASLESPLDQINDERPWQSNSVIEADLTNPSRPLNDLETAGHLYAPVQEKIAEPARDFETMPVETHLANRVTVPERDTVNNEEYYRPDYSRLNRVAARPNNELSARSRLTNASSRRATELRLDTNEFVRYKTLTGDTLQRLATKFYGKPDFYLDIYLANQDVLRSPANLPEGIVLKIPKYK